MNRSEAIAYLTRCSDNQGNHWYQGRIWGDPSTCPTCKGTDDAGWLHCPGSRYGRTSADCAPVAYRLARLCTGDYDVSADELDTAMSMVVNDSETPEAVFNDKVLSLSGADIDDIVEGYLDCQLWAGLDMDRGDNGNNPPLDENYDRGDISPEYVEKVREELLGVVTHHPLAVRMYLAHRRIDPSEGSASTYFGHDFYLTREGHGAGFWDRGLGDLGDYLTKIAEAYGSAETLFDNGEGVLA